MNHRLVTQVVVRRHQHELAALGAEVATVMDPRGVRLPPGPPRDEVFESDEAKFVARVGGEHDVARRWMCLERSEGLQPADEASAAF